MHGFGGARSSMSTRLRCCSSRFEFGAGQGEDREVFVVVGDDALRDAAARSSSSRSCGVAPSLPSQASVITSNRRRAGWSRRTNRPSSLSATFT
jgi:hypothetical protein